MRTGLVAQKVGMTRIFDNSGVDVPVTVLKVENCQVVAVKNEEKDGYTAVQIGVGKAKVKNVTKALRGHFAKANVEPKKKVVEFKVAKDATLNMGDEITVDHFVPGQLVDIVGTTIGKGFAGVIKRHHFGGMPASHGVSVSHRAHGSTGNRQDPGRVFKNKKMAGHLGDKRITVHNVKVVSVDTEQGLIMLHGAVPGAEGGWVMVQDAKKAPAPKGLPYPASVKKASAEVAVENKEV